MVRFRFSATTIYMHQDQASLNKLIQQYLQGTLSPSEKQRLEQWMAQLDISDKKLAATELHKVLMKKKIDSRTGYSAIKNTKAKRIAWYWPVAAAAILIVGCIGSLIRQHEHKETDQVANSIVKQPTLIQHYRNELNRDTLLLLEDGSRVRITPGSTLSWPKTFTHNARLLRLKGKAFFQVAKDHKRPFSVYTGDIITTALGTSFWIDNQKDHAAPSIKLITGKVSIKQRQADGRDSLLALLSPGEEWRSPLLPAQTQTINKAVKKVVKQFIQTVPDELIFENTPLTEVFPRLASYYKVTIHFQEAELKNTSFYGTYTTENQVQHIIETIALANDLRVEYNEEHAAYTIKK